MLDFQQQLGEFWGPDLALLDVVHLCSHELLHIVHAGRQTLHTCHRKRQSSGKAPRWV